MSVAVSITGVSQTYRSKAGEVSALDPIDLAIAPGSFVSLVGPSGCGKSTLLLMVAGLLARSSGEILVDGRRVDGPQTDIGIVFQGNVLVDWRNALGQCAAADRDARTGPRPLQGTRPGAPVPPSASRISRGRLPHELSGGMQQRTAFCRALIHDPPLILMDEPLGALDAMTREQLRGDLERLLMENPKTVLFVTHSIEEAVQLSDEVVVISPRPGRIVRRVKLDLPRPRDLDLRQSPEFQGIVAEIKEIFLSYGLI